MAVSEISAALKKTVEDRFGHVRVRGEISGFKRAASGHVYLALKDERAVIDGVVWKGNGARLAFAPEDGMEVVASGKLTTYPGRSKYQIVIDRLELAGEGALMAILEKRKAALRAEGLFDEARKKPLPYLPRRIGVVTSPTGSVIRDILHRLADRFPVSVSVWPARVQGETAAGEIAAAIRGFDALAGEHPSKPDLLIVARGGGSIEDLWPFNEEVVVRAVADAAIPVISAVGHETDTTLCDHAADRRAPTPTAAAEIAVPVRADLIATIDELALRMGRGARRGVADAAEALAVQRRLMPALVDLLNPYRQEVDELAAGLATRFAAVVATAQSRYARAEGSLRPVVLSARLRALRDRTERARPTLEQLSRPLRRARERLDAVWRLSQQLSPDAPLARGYALVKDAAGSVVGSAKTARAAARVSLRFADGSVPATVGGRPNRRTKPADPQQVDLFSDIDDV